MNYSSLIQKELHKLLKTAGLDSSLNGLTSLRFRSYLKRGADMMRDGWRIDPDKSAESGRRRFLLGDEKVGQILELDRSGGTACLISYSYKAGIRQTMEFDLRATQVTSNRLDMISPQAVHSFEVSSDGRRHRLEQE